MLPDVILDAVSRRADVVELLRVLEPVPLTRFAILREDDPVGRMERVVAALADAAELLELRLR